MQSIRAADEAFRGPYVLRTFRRAPNSRKEGVQAEENGRRNTFQNIRAADEAFRGPYVLRTFTVAPQISRKEFAGDVGLPVLVQTPALLGSQLRAAPVALVQET